MIITHSAVSGPVAQSTLSGLAYFEFVCSGFVAGILSGIMGVGGGVVLIPIMVLFMGMDQRTSQGISLAVIAVISFFGAFTHFKQKAVRTDIAMYVAPSALLYGLLGSFLAGRIGTNILRDVVGGIIIMAGVLAVLRDWRAGGFAS